MAVAGVFTSDSGIQGERRGDFAAGLLTTVPNGTAPLLAFTSGMPSADASDVVITWFEENRLNGRTTITNNAGTGTSIIVSDPTQFVAGDIMLVETTGEYILVNSISASTFTVQRGFGGTTAQAVDGSGTPVGFQRIGNAVEEGSQRPAAVQNLGFPVFNYMQIFRNAWEVTLTAASVDYFTGDKKAKSKRDAAMLHAENIERSIIFGRQAIGVQNGRPFRTMNGVDTFITTNVETQSSDVSIADLDTFLESIFRFNISGKPNERIAFCGNSVMLVIQDLVRNFSTYNIAAGETKYGLKISRWMTPFGDVMLKTHPLFVENTDVWNKLLLVLHPGAIRTRYLRRTKWDNDEASGDRNGVDADAGVITTEMSIEHRAEKTAGRYSGIDTAATP